MAIKAKFYRMFPKNFLSQVAGASTVGILEAVFETYSPELFGEPTRISASNPPLFNMEPLIPIEKWMVPIAGAALGIATKKARKDNVKAFGQGAMLYALPRVVSREIVRTGQAAGRNWAPPP